jgi:rhodanese-related sulfurtransferase
MKIAIVVFLSFSLLCFSCVSQRNVTLINKIELSEILKIQGGNITLVDVRTAEEFEKGTINSAQNIDFWDPEFENKCKKQLEKKDKIIVFCAGGGRSSMASKKLSRLGFKMIYDLEGGYESFIQK